MTKKRKAALDVKNVKNLDSYGNASKEAVSTSGEASASPTETRSEGENRRAEEFSIENSFIKDSKSGEEKKTDFGPSGNEKLPETESEISELTVEKNVAILDPPEPGESLKGLDRSKMVDTSHEYHGAPECCDKTLVASVPEDVELGPDDLYYECPECGTGYTYIGAKQMKQEG